MIRILKYIVMFILDFFDIEICLVAFTVKKSAYISWEFVHIKFVREVLAKKICEFRLIVCVRYNEIFFFFFCWFLFDKENAKTSNYFTNIFTNRWCNGFILGSKKVIIHTAILRVILQLQIIFQHFYKMLI